MKKGTVCIGTDEYRNLILENQELTRLYVDFKSKYSAIKNLLDEKIRFERQDDLERGYAALKPKVEISYNEYCDLFGIKDSKKYLDDLDAELSACESKIDE